jgi:hypothetical protein
VAVTDAGGREVHSGKTGDDGTAEVVLTESVYRQTTDNPKQMSAERGGPYQVAATHNGAKGTAKAEAGPGKNVTIAVR